MKKIFLCSCIILGSFSAMSQIQNPGFEMQNDDGSASYWRQHEFFVLPLDTNCTWIGMDSLRFVTNEAHSGNNALELRVAKYCDYTTGGSVKATKYNADTGFLDQRIIFNIAPSKVSFYYKLMPQMGDYAQVDIMLESLDNQTVADTSLKLKVQQSDWTLISIPFHYRSIETPVLMTMKLKISSDSIVHYGSRFLMDDFNTESITGINNPKQTNGVQLQCYPNPAKNNLSVNLYGKDIPLNGILTIMDAMGRTIQYQQLKMNKNQSVNMDISTLQPGIYSLIYTSTNGIVNTRFIKQ